MLQSLLAWKQSLNGLLNKLKLKLRDNAQNANYLVNKLKNHLEKNLFQLSQAFLQQQNPKFLLQNQKSLLLSQKFLLLNLRYLLQSLKFLLSNLKYLLLNQELLNRLSLQRTILYHSNAPTQKKTQQLAALEASMTFKLTSLI